MYVAPLLVPSTFPCNVNGFDPLVYWSCILFSTYRSYAFACSFGALCVTDATLGV